MTDTCFVGPPTREESKAMRIYYVIYSVDLMRNEDSLAGQMDPNRIGATDGRAGAVSLEGRWVETEGDEQYDFGYLAEELGTRHACRLCNGEGCHEHNFMAPDGWVGVGVTNVSTSYHGERYVTELRPCERCGGSGHEGSAYSEGIHRKWVVDDLNHEEFLALANDRGWDLDDDDRPTRYEDTMGSITEYGHLPAVAIDDQEGWSYGGEVIYAQFYVTIGELPMGVSERIKEGAPA